jgi:hypothetical protein
MLLSPGDGSLNLHQVLILPPSESIAVHPPVPLILQNPPVDTDVLPPSFAAAVHEPHILETLPELLERLDLSSTDSLRKYTKKVLHQMVDICQVGIQGQAREDVQIRLGLMDDQWRDDKLSETTKVKLGCLASALKNSDIRQADRLHLTLMVDHLAEVSQWMIGVKRIVNELKLQQLPSQPSTSRKLSTPLAATTSDNRKPAAELSVTANGQLNNNDSISGDKAVHLQETLIASTDSTAEQSKNTRVREESAEQNPDIVVNRDERISNSTDNIR